MSNFKAYLQSLGDAVLGKTVQKTETAFIAKQCLPTQATVIYPSSTTSTYQSPINGWVTVDNSGDGVAYIQAGLLTYTSATSRKALFVPCAKGEQIVIVISPLKEAIIRFYPFAGGGFLRFINGLVRSFKGVCYA